jgi:hypothetical protein
VADYVTKCRFEPAEALRPTEIENLVEALVHEMRVELGRTTYSAMVTTHSVSVTALSPVGGGVQQVLKNETPGLLVTAVFRVKRLG